MATQEKKATRKNSQMYLFFFAWGGVGGCEFTQ